jgi:D-xylonolactonase
MSSSSNVVELLVPNQDRCGEGPVWDWRRQVLVWTDISARMVYQFDPASGRAEALGYGVPAGGIALSGDGGYVVAATEGMYQWTPGSQPTSASSVEPRPLLLEHEGQKLKFNDILAAPGGRLYAGTYYWNAADEMEQAGKLYLIHPDLKIEIVADGMELSNGLGLSPDMKTLYFADSAARIIHTFDVDSTSGRLSRKRTFVKVPDDEGLPDGLTVDADGFVWSAQWYGSQVVRYDPDGKVERRIAMPVGQVASVEFGGGELDQLFITTAGERWTSRFSPPGYDYGTIKDGGAVYRVRPGVPGKKELVTAVCRT